MILITDQEIIFYTKDEHEHRYTYLWRDKVVYLLSLAQRKGLLVSFNETGKHHIAIFSPEIRS